MSNQDAAGEDHLARRNLDLEELKVRLEYRKFIWGSVFVALAVAAIPPGFQMGTAVLEYVKAGRQLQIDEANKKADRETQQQAFRDNYVKEFLKDALNQNIELRIRFAEYFSFVSAEPYKANWADYRKTLMLRRNEIREEINRMEKELYAIPANDRDGDEAQRLVRNLRWKYEEVGYQESIRTLRGTSRDFKVSRDSPISVQFLMQLFEPLGQQRDETQLVLDGFAKHCTSDPKDVAIYLSMLLSESAFLRSRLVEGSYRNTPADRVLKIFPTKFKDAAEVKEVIARGDETFFNHVYGSILGNKEPGDGWRYRGRGYIMATGRDNYRKLDKALALNGLLEKEPDRLADQKLAIEASAFLICEAIADVSTPDKATDLGQVWRRLAGGPVPPNVRSIYERIQSVK